MQIQWGVKQSPAKLFKDQREAKPPPPERKGMTAILLQLEMAAKVTRAVGKGKWTEARAVVTHRDKEPPDQVPCSTGRS